MNVDELHNQISDYIQKKQHQLILNVNVHCLNLAYKHTWLRDFLNQAAIVFCDGAGVMLGAKVLGHHIPERITYADWIWQLAEFAEPRGYTFYFLGAQPGIAQQAAEKLLQKHPKLNIVGVLDGYFDKTLGSADNEAILSEINRLKPNILILGMGMPLQEQWLMENWERLEVNIALTGGAVFDYISGNLQRAPQWMTDNGLEWLGRLLIEPRRLWKRYIIGNPIFLWRVLKQKIRQRQQLS
ncbi:MAG: WecB/TagA/CpsF family glycosyltransferase [Chloroflexi bacterium]|nr:WecB/TagA/CpsF family glycosyltransferase [Chloroflexota bacterium]